jgi:hypothetical protein
MKNDLIALQGHVFSMIERLKDESLQGDNLKQEIERSLAINELAKTAVTNGALMVKAADTLYGLPVSDELPLIPPSKTETPVIAVSKKKALIELPKVGREQQV